MFQNIFQLLAVIIADLSGETVNLINNIMGSYAENETSLQLINFNLILFGETPIISTNVYDMLLMFFGIFYSMFFIVLLYKGTKKFINMIFGVFKI